MSSKAGGSETLDVLKDLLLKDEKEQIQRIENRLDDPMVRAKEISQSLAEAISLSIMSHNKISRVLQPVIDDSIKISVKNNPKALADAISPALGPGIRKAITSTIMGMIQSLNHVLNHSFSIQGIKWRFEAFRTRKQFAEIVMLHTLLYQVEQIFLIHRESGIVLEHVVAKDIIIQDPDLVSGMLTAIQDFVNDSFHTDAHDDLETLRMGSDRSVWIENGEHALIAAVIRGTPPVDLRIKYRELIEEIHIKAGSALEKFDGDPLPFSIFREHLKDGLQSQEKKNQKRTSPLLWCTFIIILSIVGIWGFTIFKTHQLWHQYLNRLETQKGLIILSTQKKEGKYQIYGLRDPMAKDPRNLLQKKEKEHLAIISHWEAFYSLDPEFVFNRAQQILNPPSTVSLALSGNIIIAKGQASQAWIETFQTTASTLPGIHGFNDDMIKNIDKKKLDIILKKLRAIKIYFESNSTKFIKGQENVLAQAFKTIQNIQTLQSKLKNPIQIAILGHTDSSGTEKVNQRLSRNRAEKIFNYLIVKGINPVFLTISGVGTKNPLIKETSMNDRQYNRAITFKTFYNPSTQGS
ncbi:MAG: OmpA family protein [Desulfobacula sp.]|uniref:OmpA family protein n=1 Tax=Desulfobacula sp. TaxID=2593537 RepID=UPI0025BF7E1D|nr:OmpA family protein [Desulfobacula sp.]MCD4719135.1 OmpA family protein [Desulfobacula sp.]